MQLVVSGMDCDHYADHLTRALKRLPGVLGVSTKLADHIVAVHFAPDKVDVRMITAAVERAGYGIVRTEDIALVSVGTVANLDPLPEDEEKFSVPP